MKRKTTILLAATFFTLTLFASLSNAEILQNIHYVYDAVGNITSIQDRDNEGQSFAYDELNRLKSVNTPTYGRKYTYSSNGRILSKEGKRYFYDDPDHPDAPTSDGIYTMTYNGNGNLITKVKIDGSVSWEYFYFVRGNRLKQVKKDGVVVADYWYDYAGTMVKKIEGDNEYLYINPMYELHNRVVHKYYYANGERISERVGSGADSKVYYYNTNHLGSTILITDQAGEIVKRVSYYPFGSERIEDGDKESPYKFTGKRYSTATGLYYYEARFYDPELGVFITPDPLFSPDLASQSGPGAKGSVDMATLLRNPQRLNRYAYTLNNPVNYVDPDGRDAIPIVFPDYKITTPAGKIGGLGHAGILLINPKSGLTKYYEYGRYNPTRVVKRYIPNVVMGENGMPTDKSLQNVLKSISEQAGHAGRIEGAYIENENFDAMNKFAQKDYGSWSFLNNCGTFMQDVLEAGNVNTPLMFDPRPNSYSGELRDEYPNVDYNTDVNFFEDD